MQEACQSCQLPCRDGPATADSSEDGGVQGFDERIEVQSIKEKIEEHTKHIEAIITAGVKTSDTIQEMQAKIDLKADREGAPKPSYLQGGQQSHVKTEVEKAMRTRIEDAVREAMGSKDDENTNNLLFEKSRPRRPGSRAESKKRAIASR